MKHSSTWFRSLALTALLLASSPRGWAQWITQSFNLGAGWNAVYLHVDATHDTLDHLIGNDPANLIQEIWMWAPTPSASQFVTSPKSPSQPTLWLSWSRSGPTATPLARLDGNAAYLVRTSAAYTWNLKGKAVAPSYQWTSSGLNFIGFPTPPGATPPTFDSFFAPAPDLRVSAELYTYRGGTLTNNPVALFDLAGTRVERGRAFWMRAAQFNRYFGPFEVAFAGTTGARFGDTLGQVSFRLRNITAQPQTVRLTAINSETAPTGQPTVRGQVPVLVRGDLNPTNLTYQHTALISGAREWTLPKAGDPGSDIEIVLGVNRLDLSGSPGDLFAGVLRFTDAGGLTQVDVPISATVSSRAGLWVGGATVSAVSHYLKPFAKATTLVELTNALTHLGLGEGTNGFHYELDVPTSRILVFGGTNHLTGSYLVDGPINTSAGTVARPFPLRLILHHDGTNTHLLQKVHYGIGLNGTTILSTREDLLQSAQLASARRISCSHLPTSLANRPWDFTGTLRWGSNITAAVETAFDDQTSNPFLHTYHPDHDNLDAAFAAPLARGLESYGIRRQITLSFANPSSDFDSLTKGGAALTGTYVEVVTLLGNATPSRQYDVRGTFALNRISDIATLTTQ